MEKLLGSFLLLIVLFACKSQENQKISNKKPNILFIAIDDLRPELGSYGSNIAISPNLDKLSSEGLQFNRAYCQQAICGPSRASLMTGIRPESSGVFHNYIKFREANPDVTTIPQNFVSHGYQSVYYGKIFHHGDEDSISWSRPTLKAPENSIVKGGFALPENQKIKEDAQKEMFSKYGDVAKYGLAMGPAYEAADVPDDAYSDGENTNLAIETMQQMVKEGGKPFFLGLGFHKPHLNWVAPKKYWDLYDEFKIELSPQKNPPKDGATMGIPPSFELRVRSGIPKIEPFGPALERKLKHAYLACVSYVDAQIGRMLVALDEAGIRDNTIIIVWSDHGWHLGEMGYWGKATDYEIATRVPLIIWTPDMPDANRGVTTDALVELVDIYPTLSELANISMPKNIEGQSFAPLLQTPNRPWKKAAFSVFPSPALREWGAYPIRSAMRETYFGPLLKQVETKIIAQQKEKWDRDLFENRLMGYSMRTERYRFTIWKDYKDKEAKSVFYELYDHEKDPSETVNIAGDHPDLVAELLNQFDKGWKGNMAQLSK